MAQTAVASPAVTVTILLRQAGIMIALAASVALGLYVALWSRTPEYQPLYTDLSDRDLSKVVSELEASRTPYRIDHRSGVVLVAADALAEVRLRLAAAGLPKSSGMGFEILNEEQGFGISQFREHARYQHAVEAELSRSISRITNIRAARVHIATPKQSAFARSRRNPTASVIVDLYSGRRLEHHQVSAIVHMVSAAVPGLTPDHVTVIDQQGSLLSDGHGTNDELAVTAKRFDYTRRLEQSYIDRVEAILMPLVGPDGVRAQVTAEVDFTSSEQTRESFNPDLPAVRSESVLEEERLGASDGGVPGALSNEPPAATVAPEEGVAELDGAGTTENKPSNRRSQTTRNYELDRTIAHTKRDVGKIERLSVAVVVRNPPREEGAQQGAAADGENAGAASGFAEAELQRMEHLVKEAIGFNAERGDSVSVTNADFLKPEALEPLPEPAIWEQPWVWSVGKQVLAGLFVLFVLLGVIRPAVKGLMAKPLSAPASDSLEGDLVPAGAPGQQAALGVDGSPAALPGALGAGGADGQPLLASSDVSADLDSVKQFVAQEPKIAAQVLKGWVGDE